jgi:hypothetical protein
LAASFGDLAMVIESETSGAATLQWNVGWVDVVELPGAGEKGSALRRPLWRELRP